ncbi:MAG: SDR family oxidoreductase [Clostridia bacterium]|nr:SDR family oxidoreductase [Clostridia bacterium]
MKTVLITGAVRNTGLAIARRFASEGWQVAITSRDSESEQARKTVFDLEKEYGIKARGYSMSYNSISDIRNTFQKVKEDFGGLDTFVANSAALGIGVDLLGTEEADFDSIVDVNLKGTFFCCQSAAELMKENGGSIVTIGSVQGTGAVAGRTVYGITKAAISQLVRSMAFELGEYGIRANNIVAGAIHSDRWDSLSPEELAARRSRYPAGRESTEEEISNAVWFLGTDLSKTITGTDLTVDSGISVCLLPYKKKEN